MKRVIKLNDNTASPKRGDPLYNPAYKFDMIYDAIVKNTNCITMKAEDDQCGDETTWGHGGFGEAGSGLVGRIVGKPGVSKGGQLVLVSDVSCCHPRAYVHRHKLHFRPDGYVEGPNEVRLLTENIIPQVRGETAASELRQIYVQKPHCTWDNYFSGDVIMNHLGENGFGATMTCRRDGLPSDIPEIYLHKKKTDAAPRSKAARFNHPIVAVREYPASMDGSKLAYQRVHTSFQSTSSCNISTVNALQSCHLYVRNKERGRGEQKRHWGIEMNQARDLYLNSYYRIDTIDHLIKNTDMFYRSWKYWHSPMIHGKSLAVVVAYDMYLECCEGNLKPGWKIDAPVTFWRFREKLPEQMLQYDARERRYPGDEFMRQSTHQRIRDRPAKRTRRAGRPNKSDGETPGQTPAVSGVVTMEQIEDAKKKRLNSLTEFQRHWDKSRAHRKHPNKCFVCGEDSYHRCEVCNVPLHGLNSRSKNAEHCFIDYHNDRFFGLARGDCALVNTLQRNWCQPTAASRKQNTVHVANLMGPAVDDKIRTSRQQCLQDVLLLLLLCAPSQQVVQVK